jgi:signal transduction histidine kinase
MDDALLRFFGRMTASMTHEVKNALATVNENAGLLTDYAEMTLQGKPLDPERVYGLAARIADQVTRADGLLKNLNRFAHSVDESLIVVDVTELLKLLAALSIRFASMSEVSLNVREPAGPVVIETSPFSLLNTLFGCLEFAMRAAGRGRSLELRAEKGPSGVCIHFEPLPQCDGTPGDPPDVDETHSLPGSLEGRFVMNRTSGNLSLLLSKRA